MPQFKTNFNIQIPFGSVNFDRDSFKLHEVLQYNNLTYNQVKLECFSLPIGQKSILKIVKLAIFAYISVLNLVHLITILISSSCQFILYALILDKLQFSNPL